jgi:cytochrome c oxidase assembly protein subunit 15
MAHRIGALVVTSAILALSFVYRKYPSLKKALFVILSLLSLQVVFGIINVVMSLPMFAAVMHNAVALALLLSLLYLTHRIFKNNPLI